ncbi:MAG: DUF5982 domain-containing protein [Leptospiraceae bacterium]|nr:DUF5982 domain-containing protein [Leptospiraceae bacterium]
MKLFQLILIYLILVQAIVSEETLPFKIDPSKKMSPEELKEKKENSFITGIPGYSVDPVSGTWLGGTGYYFENGKKTEALFAYAPYKYRVGLDVYQSFKNAKYYAVSLDIPFVANTPYRINTFLVNDVNPKALYFGVGESTLEGLNYKNRYGETIYNANYAEREENLSYRRKSKRASEGEYVTDTKYNEYSSNTTVFSLNLDRTVFGKFRVLLGADFSKISIETYDGKWFKSKDPIFGETKFPLINSEINTPNSKTKLTEDFEAGKINGYKGGYINYIKAGIAYDTRDFEISPRKGIFSEIIFTKVSRLTGSPFEFNREFFQFKAYQILFPKVFEELVIAGRVAFTRVSGTVPFTEYKYMYSMDGPIVGLGGQQTLRGYKQDRFVGNYMGFGNLELRYRFGSFNLGEENFVLSFVPSFDFGRVWDKVNSIGLRDYMYSYTLGLRIIWNQSTVISMDYGRSREDSQFFLDLGQTF